MFSYIKLKNFKSLVDFSADFNVKKDTPQPYVIVYGENGSGKTNLVSCFYFLMESIMTKDHKIKIENILEQLDKKSKIDPRIIMNMISRKTDIHALIESYKTINSKGLMELEFGFKIDNKKGFYKIVTDDTTLVEEQLDFVINKKITNLYKLSSYQSHSIYQNNEFSEVFNKDLFLDNNYKTEIIELLQQYWGKHSLLAILNSEINDKTEKYLKTSINNTLFLILNYFKSISIDLKGDEFFDEKMIFIKSDNILLNLKKGEIDKKEILKLERIEKFLNIFFPSLYSDIKKIYYKKNILKETIKYTLYEKKIIYGKLTDLPFYLESTGTKHLLSLVPFLISAMQGNTVIIDEIDSGIHDLLMTVVLEDFLTKIKGQVIITTHNTNLLESSLLNKNTYLMNIDRNANKELISIESFERLHPNLNIRKRYLKGLYGGVPSPRNLDFDELISIFNN